MAILGYSLSELPALFLFPHFTQQLNWQIFLTRMPATHRVSAGYMKAFAILRVRLYKSPLLSTQPKRMTPPCVALVRYVYIWLSPRPFTACFPHALEVIKVMNPSFSLYGSLRSACALAILPISISVLLSSRSFVRCGNYPDTSAG
ncbi:hypothetical protein [Pantoea sp. App145]|uniref:hypothetical protein n=1 Tax=Pantoea sp. App145 TaxID=3071567 RepID=UPI003A80B219